MKLSIVLLSCADVLLNARPEAVSHGLRVDANSSTGEDSKCQGSPAAADRINRCKQPGVHVWDKLLCKNCNWFWPFRTDAHPECKIPCCDNSADVHDNKCKCTGHGKKYVIDRNRAHVVGLNTAEKCCGRDVGRRPKIHHADHEACGCGDVGTSLKYGGKDSDCCSGRKDNNNQCIKRTCAKKGESGECCRTADNYESPKDTHSTNCGCFHAGATLNANDEVGWDNCCSGKANAANNACGCIDDTSIDLPAGANANDCCSGQLSDDGKHCKAATCTEVGAKLATGGDHCCSGAQVNGVCACIPSGHVPQGGAPLRAFEGGVGPDCCSLKVADGKCAFLFKGAPVPNFTDARSVCNSGRKDSSNRCRCVNKGATTQVESDCCSGSFLNPSQNICGCVPPNGALEYGAGEGACCTKSAVEGHCTCGVPGAPVLDMMIPQRDCCAKDTKQGSNFCGCVGPDATHSLTSETSEYCCGGSSHFDGQNCSCVQNGQAVGGWGHDGACCSGHIEQRNYGSHTARVCDTLAGDYEVLWNGHKREGVVLKLECDDTFSHTDPSGQHVAEGGSDHLHYDHLGIHCGAEGGHHSSHATFWMPYGATGKVECLHKIPGGLLGDHWDVVNGAVTFGAEVQYNKIRGSSRQCR